jgi:transcriptional regulator with XRE-family HTH domain
MKRGRPIGSKTRRGKAARVDHGEVGRWVIAVAREIRDKRLETDVSVAELSAATGVTKSTLHRIERFANNPADPAVRKGGSTKIATIVRIALALGVTPQELMPT